MATNLTAEIILEGKYLGGQAVSQAIGDQQALHDKITANMAVMSRLTAESAAAVGAITQHANATTASATVMGQHTTMTAASAAGLGQHASAVGASGTALGQHVAVTTQSGAMLTQHAGAITASGNGLNVHATAVTASSTALGQHAAASAAAGGGLGIMGAAAEKAISPLGRIADMATQGFGMAIGFKAIQEVGNALESMVPSAARFETTLNRVKQNTGMTSDELAKMRTSVIDLSRESGVSTDLISAGFQRAQNVVQNTGYATVITDIAMKSAVSTGGDVAKTTDVLARAMHEYGTDTSRAGTETARVAEVTKNAAGMMAVFHVAAQQSDMTLQEFSDNSSRAVGLSAQLGISVTDAAAALATLAKHGFDAAGAQVQYVDSLIHMVNPTKAATTELQRMSDATGINLVAAFSAAGLKQNGYIGTLEMLHTAMTKAGDDEYSQAAMLVQLGLGTDQTNKAVKSLGLSQENVTGETMKLIQAQRGGIGTAAMLTVGWDDLRSISNKLVDAEKAGTVTQEGWNDTLLTTEQRWKIFTNNIQLGTMAIGDQFLPMMNDAIGALSAAGPKISTFAIQIKDQAGSALQGMASALATTGASWAPWAAGAGAAGTAVSGSLTGVSGVVQSLQFVLQGNYTAAWKTAQGAMGDFGGALDAVGRILDSNRNLILGVGAALGAFVILGTVVPAVIAAGSAIAAFAGGIAAWITVMGPVSGTLGAIVAILGGPVTLAIAGVALAIGALTVAWANNWGDIQGKTAAATGAVRGSLSEFQADLKTTADKAGGFRDSVNTTFDALNDNITGKVRAISQTISTAWDQDKTDATTQLAAFRSAVDTAFGQTDAAITKRVNGWTKTLSDAWAQDQADASKNLSSWGSAVDGWLKPVTDKLEEWARNVRKTFGDVFSGLGTVVQNALGAAGSAVAAAGGGGMGGSAAVGSVIGLANQVNAAGGAATPYVWGGAQGRTDYNSDIFSGGDCSGFVSWIYYKATGKKLPAYVADLVDNKISTQIDASMASPGDLVAYNPHGAADEQHVGIYSRPGYMIDESTASGGGVQERAIRSGAEYYRVNGSGIGAPGNGYDTNRYGNGGTAAIPAAGDTAGWATWLKNSGTIPSDLINDPTFLNILLTGGRGESGLNAGKVQNGYTMGSGVGARGLFQFDMAGMGKGQSEEFLTSAAGAQWQAQQIVPKYAKAYRSSSAQGMTGAQQAAFVASAAERPAGNYPGGDGWNNYVRNFQPGAGDAPGGGYDTSAFGVRTAPEVVAAAAVETPGLLDATSGDPTGFMARQKAGKDAAAPFEKKLTTSADSMGDWLVNSQRSEAKDIAKLDLTGQREIDKIMPAAQDKVADSTAARALAQQNKDAKDALAERQADQLRAFQEQQAAAMLVSKRVDEDNRIVQTRAREDQRITANEGLAAEARRHTQVLQDADIQHQKTLQLEATAHTYKLQDAKILADERLALTATEHSRRLQDEQQLVNEKLALQQTLHQRGLQDQALADGAVLSATASVHSRGLQDKEAAYQHVRSLDKEADSYAQQLANATTDVQRKAIEQRHQDALKTQADQWAEALVQTAHARQLQDEEAKYQEGLRVIALQKSRVQADIEQKYKDGLADSALQDSRKRADTEAAYQQGLRATALVTARGLAEQEQQYKDGLAATALTRSRGLQDVEVEYQKSIARAALVAKRADEDAARAETRAKEDADIKAKTAADKIARDFAKQQKDDMQALDRAQSDASFKLSTDRILADAAQARADRQQRLIDDKAAVVEKYDTERKAHLDAFLKDAAGIKELAKTAVEAAGGDFAPIAAKMDSVILGVVADYGKGHDASVAALADLSIQTATAAANVGKSLTAIGTDAADNLGADSPAAKAIEVSDAAVEKFADQFGKSWPEARDMLGQIEQGIYKSTGPGGVIPNAISVSNEKVIAFAKQWGVSWPEAAGILTTESDRIKNVFGEGGVVTSAMKASETAAGTLNRAIQGIQDKEIKVTTNYISQGSQAASGAAGAMVGGQGGSRSGGGEAAGGPGPNAPISSGSSSGSYDFSTYSGRQAARDANPGAVVDAGGIYRPPGHAAGGPMNQGDVSIVGERGPELFKAGSQGYVFPSGTSMGGSGVTDAQLDRLADRIIVAMRSANLTVSVSDIHAQLLQMARRNGGAGLA